MDRFRHGCLWAVALVVVFGGLLVTAFWAIAWGTYHLIVA